ncbi:class I SAM-dependent DNA methyltransferase [Bradyrhizobium niftali]|nr:class I SAM-dependent methyltransferase [Bradyrhizobium niftali]
MDFSSHDTRGYQTVSAAAGYDEWSKFYDATVSEQLDLPLLEKSLSLKSATFRDALDLGCGTGRIGCWLKQRLIENIDGIDLSERMLEQASRKGCYRALKLADMLFSGLPSTSYDLIINSMAVEHVEDLEVYYAESSRLLKADGLLVTIGFHQYFLLNGIPTHFDRRDGSQVAIRNYIHLFSDHFTAATANDFTLAEVEEAVVDRSWIAERPAWRRYVNKPVSYMLVWRKIATPGTSISKEA